MPPSECRKLAGPGCRSGGMIFNEHDQEVRDLGYQKHAFNMLISNRLGYHREVPDTRDAKCREKSYPSDLPFASIVICFYNEAFSALLRTVHSVLDRTPAYLLHEIILVDDNSELVDLKKDLDEYIKKNLPRNTKLVRNEKREGLIRGRMIGASHATGKVLVFLDSHCEVNEMWLQPLLVPIREDSKTVVCPVIDIISADTLIYSSSPVVRGGFNWGLHFKWDLVPLSELEGPEGATAPIKSPTMAGGLFAMDREYFNELGQYDSGMDIWGGENLEISFRIWMCGGRLLIIPCSRVGHIFRKRRPYGSPGGKDTMAHNSLRLAHVWMDEYKEQYFALRPELRTRNYGNITDRVELRKKMNCKSFKWYLDNIYPEMQISGPNAKAQQPVFINRRQKRPKILQHGRLYHLQTNKCLVAQGHPSQKGGLVVVRECDYSDQNQIWIYNEDHELILNNLLCLDVSETRSSDPPRLMKCHGSGGSQQWMFGKNNRLYQVSVGQCMKVVDPLSHKGYVTMAICDGSLPQQWHLES
ncbi:polypeptide N-acetylgalactosaminyltransferase 11 isoform X3 [Lepidochelys kempii]|uniref:polypeptide N-acetylgalactosaminyltransferase 11 isoform X3 n=1 Tax=Lepidochelys kempii TaxID=8472 RepID=UPI003C6F076E